MEVFIGLNQREFGYAVVEQNPDRVGHGRAQQWASELASANVIPE